MPGSTQVRRRTAGASSRKLWRAAASGAVLALVATGVVQIASTAQAEVPPVTLFGNATPATPSDSDTQAVELGVRFSSDVAGSIAGVRFYKGRYNTGTHRGSLWSASGQRLARATFAGETATGWQTVRFSTPVAVAAGRTYVASYYASRGRYAADNGYFSGQVDSGPLHAPAGNNGVYRYGTGGFPTQTYQNTNYYVDVLFTPAVAPTPVTPSPSVAPSVAPSPTASASPSASPTVSASPSASPTPTSSPAPVGVVAYGWQLTTSNTGLAGAGIARSSLPTFSGTVTAGMTLSRVKITGALDLSSTPNVTLDRVWLAPSGGFDALTLGSGTVVKDSDIDGASMQQGSRVGIKGTVAGAYDISRTAITGMSVGAWLDGSGPGTMSETYVHSMTGINGSHMDAFTRRGGTGALLISRSRLDASGPSVTGAFFLQNTWGDRIAGITLKDSYLEGGGFALTLENKGAGTAVGLDNVRIRSTGWGPITASGGITYTAWNNVRVYDGSRLPSADGAAISAG